MKKLVVLGLLALDAQAATSPQKLARSVTIYRDNYGVPHIYGPTDASVVFGLMYAQGEDNFWQLEEDYIRALGRRAEIYGESGVMNDAGVRAFETLRLARMDYDKAGARIRALADAFAAGLNYYLERNPKVTPRLITRFEPWHAFAFLRGSSLESAELARAGITRADILRAFPGLNAPQGPFIEPPLDEGSNMWAAAPVKSASGRTLLLINPHVGFFGGGQRYEAHLNSKEGLRVSGFAILGTPFIRSGFNERLGWSHTNNYADVVDVYAEKFDDPGNPLAYRYGDGHRMATEWEEEIRVKTERGVETRRVRLRKTHHGPIVAVRDGMAFAVRTVRQDRGPDFEQRVTMARSRSLAEFKAAMDRRTIVGSNTIYADRKGNIFYVHGNTIPRRSLKFDWSRPLDASDPETEWQGYHALDELPQMTNPKSGYLQNCNSTPFQMTADGNLPADRYPKYMAPEPDTPRAQVSRRILSGREKFTFEEWARSSMDTSILAAERELPALFAVFERLKEQDAAHAEKLADAMAELRSWNFVSTPESVAMTLFVRWAPQIAGSDPFLALEKVKVDLEKSFGAWRVPWGEVNRLQRIHTSGVQEPFDDSKPSLPVAGAPGTLGCLFAFNTRTPPGGKRSYGFSGNSYLAVVEFGKKLQARSLLVFGQSADPASPHHFDQAGLYSKKQYKPAWFYFSDVKRHAERVYHPGL